MTSASNEAHRGDTLGLNTLLMMLRRYRFSIALISILGTALGVFLVSKIEPVFGAGTLLLLDVRGTQVLDHPSVVRDPDRNTDWEWIARSEMQVLHSERLIRTVIERLDLASIEGFPTSPGLLDRTMSAVTDSEYWPFDSDETEDDAAEGQLAGGETAADADQDGLIDAYKDALAVWLEEDTFVIGISFAAADPALAALVANTHAEVYLESQERSLAGVTESATAWLDEQVEAQRAALRAAEQAVQDFREEHQVVDGPQQGSVLAERLATLNAEMAVAEADAAFAKARLARVREGAAAPADRASAEGSVLVDTLRESISTLRAEEARLATDLGERHPARVAIAERIARLAAELGGEQDRIERELEEQVQVAERRVAALEASLQRLEERTLTDEASRSRLRELQQEAQTGRELVQALLARSKELELARSLTAPEASVIEEARVPSKPFWPRTKVLVALSFIAATGTGVALALLRELMNRTARSARDIERAVGIRCVASLPLMQTQGTARALNVGRRGRSFFRMAARYADGIRTIHTLAEGEAAGSGPLKILVTSSLPGEGKTTCSVLLAEEMARAGYSTLLVDADVRRRGASRSLKQLEGADNDQRYLEPTLDPEELHTSRGFHFVPIRRAPSRGKLVEMLDRWEKRYDRIIFDCPPVAALSDPLQLAPVTDLALILVRSGKTDMNLLETVVQRLADAGASRVGAVLNGVDVRQSWRFWTGDPDHYYEEVGKYYDPRLRGDEKRKLITSPAMFSGR